MASSPSCFLFVADEYNSTFRPVELLVWDCRLKGNGLFVINSLVMKKGEKKKQQPSTNLHDNQLRGVNQFSVWLYHHTSFQKSLSISYLPHCTLPSPQTPTTISWSLPLQDTETFRGKEKCSKCLPDVRMCGIIWHWKDWRFHFSTRCFGNMQIQP